jgi:hypothetical protein
LCIPPGTKLDLWNPVSEGFVTSIDAITVKNLIGAFSIIECSAKQKTNVAKVFAEAVRAVELAMLFNKKPCSIL